MVKEMSIEPEQILYISMGWVNFINDPYWRTRAMIEIIGSIEELGKASEEIEIQVNNLLSKNLGEIEKIDDVYKRIDLKIMQIRSIKRFARKELVNEFFKSLDEHLAMIESPYHRAMAGLRVANMFTDAESNEEWNKYVNFAVNEIFNILKHEEFIDATLQLVKTCMEKKNYTFALQFLENLFSQGYALNLQYLKGIIQLARAREFIAANEKEKARALLEQALDFLEHLDEGGKHEILNEMFKNPELMDVLDTDEEKKQMIKSLFVLVTGFTQPYWREQILVKFITFAANEKIQGFIDDEMLNTLLDLKLFISSLDLMIKYVAGVHALLMFKGKEDEALNLKLELINEVSQVTDIQDLTAARIEMISIKGFVDVQTREQVYNLCLYQVNQINKLNDQFKIYKQLINYLLEQKRVDEALKLVDTQIQITMSIQDTYWQSLLYLSIVEELSRIACMKRDTTLYHEVLKFLNFMTVPEHQSKGIVTIINSIIKCWRDVLAMESLENTLRELGEV